VKIAIVGGGSTYTPELIDGFARLRDDLPLEEVWLVDPDADRLAAVSAVSERMFARAGYPVKVVGTSDLVAGVSDADAVLLQLRIDGQAARHGDESWPHDAGCLGQETTGPGGLAKALRTVPVVLDIGETVRRHAKPDAWIIDFTNPVGIVTRALLQAGHRAVGLCNVAMGFQRRFADVLGVDPDLLALDHVGLNHLTWERGVTLTTPDGPRDVMPLLLGEHLEAMATDVRMPASLLTMQRAIPSYYLRYYYAGDRVLREQIGAPTRAQQVLALEAALLAKYRDPSVDEKPAELEKRGGAYYSDAAVAVIASLATDRGDVQALNVRNDGTFPFLPDDHVIEVPTQVRSAGLRPQQVAPLPDDLVALVSHAAAYERLALDAAVHGGRERVVRAMLANPVVGQYEKAERLTDLLLAANAEHLAWAR